MKPLILGLFFLSFAAHAENCKIVAVVDDGQEVFTAKIKLKVATASDCKDSASSIEKNHFFGAFTKQEKILKAKYKFRKGLKKIKGEVEF